MLKGLHIYFMHLAILHRTQEMKFALLQLLHFHKLMFEIYLFLCNDPELMKIKF